MDEQTEPQQKYPLPQRKPLPQENVAKKSRISNTEWGLVIGALAMADVSMFLLDLFGIGEFIDPFIDGFILMAWPLYLHLRGQSMSNNKRLAGVIATGLVGLLSDGFLDFWWADGVYNMYLAKAEDALAEIEAKVPGNVRQMPSKNTSEQQRYDKAA